MIIKRMPIKTRGFCYVGYGYLCSSPFHLKSSESFSEDSLRVIHITEVR